MTIDQSMSTTTVENVESAVQAYLETKLKSTVEPDQDLMASGLVSSMFAMQLVVYLESTFGVAVVGSDLKLDNFRSVRSMTALVERLQGADSDG
ncbi:acyl carrier protein [Lentzea sp. JNUCC 0626]|uniref:acyl carrier protein n=1 Tax=Lentzea sp. JNUCC 0626 TaxID=3367513 RepID=UPI0037496915